MSIVCIVLSVFVDVQHDAQDMSTARTCSPAACSASNARGGNSSKIDTHVHSRCVKCSFAANWQRGELAKLGDAIAVKKSHEMR